MQTSQLLTEMDFANDHFFKRLYNYNLASNRNVYETKQEICEEFFASRQDPKIAKLWYEINKMNTIEVYNQKLGYGKNKFTNLCICTVLLSFPQTLSIGALILHEIPQCTPNLFVFY